MTNECARTEMLAGAIALGEASDVERDAYRRHVATCARCLDAFGGEREIERVMSVIEQARTSESWEPDLRALRRGSTARRRAWAFGLSGLAAAFAISLGIHAIVAANISAPVATENAAATVADSTAFQVSVERRPAGVAGRAGNPAPRAASIQVENHVVTLARPQPAVPPPVMTKQAAAKAQPAKSMPVGGVAASGVSAGDVAALKPSLHDEGTIASMQTAPSSKPVEGRAESLNMVPNSILIRDVTPIGGESAIVPRPSSIAYDEGAEGTTAFEVTVDDRGAPVRCSITKPSGYLVLDDSVCKAAMRAHYLPRTVNGRATSSVYRDAFTFRLQSPP